ncbi:MAG: ATP-binding cassette domain-containing protein, partial [Clostridiales bacterium]|nr:ATP-binding cassette domain-containing protein [Clostridiales bacterium]
MLEIEHLYKKYRNSERFSVEDLNLVLQPGEIFGFLGQNGAGKSTTIKC